MSKEGNVKLFCLLFITLTLSFTHAKTGKKDFDLLIELKDDGNKTDISTDACNSAEDCNSLGECIGVAGEKVCKCYNGLSGRNCKIIDECVQDSGMCGSDGDAECLLNKKNMKAYCQCKEKDRSFDVPTKKCVPLNCECGKESSGCNFTDGVKECFCNQGFKELNGICEKCDCGANSTDCQFKNGKKVCTCKPGFKVGNYSICTPMCDDQHPCANGGLCLQDICVCLAGTGGSYCESVYDCENKLCGDEVSCQYDIPTQRAYCQCSTPQHTYDSYDKSCKKCDCGNNSTDCQFKDGKKVCTCVPGFKVGNYSICTPMCDDQHPCANGGRCLQDICACLAGTGGPYCERVYDCENKLCGDVVSCQYDTLTQRAYCQCSTPQHTYDSYDKSCKKCICGEELGTDWERCDFVLGTKVCQCSEGYTYSPKADKCLECDCGNNSKTCDFDDKGQKVCQCLKGYIDNLGTCRECECGSNGKCSFDSYGNFSKCLCDSGFSDNSGKCVFCDCGPKSKCSFQNNRKMCACAKGFKDEKGYCTDIDECLNTEACPGPGTLCENTLGSYKCRCQLSYQGRSPTESDKKTLCEKIVEAGPNYTPWKIGYGLLSAGFIVIIAGLAYVIFRMYKSLKSGKSNIPLRNRNHGITNP